MLVILGSNSRYLNAQQEHINALESNAKEFKKNVHETLKEQTFMQQQEINRLNQTREWVKQNKKEQDEKIKRLENQLFDLETHVHNFQDCELSQ